MRGRRLLQSITHNWFLQEAFDGHHKNARGKKNSFDKKDLKRLGRKFRYNKDYKKDIDNET